MKLKSARSTPGSRVPPVVAFTSTVGVGVFRAVGGVGVGCVAAVVGTGVLGGGGVAVAALPQATTSNRIKITGKGRILKWMIFY